jgi:hypothetical protein
MVYQAEWWSREFDQYREWVAIKKDDEGSSRVKLFLKKIN